MKTATDEELKEALAHQRWVRKTSLLNYGPTALRRHQLVELALKRWIADRRKAKRGRRRTHEHAD